MLCFPSFTIPVHPVPCMSEMLSHEQSYWYLCSCFPQDFLPPPARILFPPHHRGLHATCTIFSPSPWSTTSTRNQFQLCFPSLLYLGCFATILLLNQISRKVHSWFLLAGGFPQVLPKSSFGVESLLISCSVTPLPKDFAAVCWWWWILSAFVYGFTST